LQGTLISKQAVWLAGQFAGKPKALWATAAVLSLLMGAALAIDAGIWAGKKSNRRKGADKS
jgi:hypothetical protein